MAASPGSLFPQCLMNLRTSVPSRVRRWQVEKGAAAVFFASLLLAHGGCTRTVAERGVEPLWRSMSAEILTRGITSKAEVLERLGPPSQVITEGRGEIFYYLHEETRTSGLVLVVYNKSETETRYDRAIFFFDADGILKEYALSAVSEGER